MRAKWRKKRVRRLKRKRRKTRQINVSPPISASTTSVLNDNDHCTLRSAHHLLSAQLTVHSTTLPSYVIRQTRDTSLNQSTEGDC
ncbi:hypothetical protein BU25DRAFT_254447 [Macroventuria anomochaeta]|uniref:Uncharacterized protein n=1 Tax=Macroventuria anomochaeta TaxID=301207 RepID=A0ACB6S890_9PLEO|nr:uncharacterized protein BU25DRAFT_254447 [Macroventuria anomochaeta]KAF2630212.1 hypothetical protein BU25DRAFT_254447 [Macroventuria anomochaeta]